MRAPIGWLACVFAALVTARLHADEVPLVQPQWIVAQTEDELVYDRIAASVDPVSIAMPDGDTVTATVTNTEIVLRRYSAAGAVTSARAVPFDLGGSSNVELVLRANAAYDAFYLLAGGVQTSAVLMRLDGSFLPEWSVSLPNEAICESEDGHCLRLEQLGDGSLVAMRAYRTMRIGDDGTVQWSVVDPGASGGFRGGDLAIGTTAIWVATSGGNSGLYDSTATLTRLDFDGTHLSTDVSSCQGCGGATFADIEATDDGGARVVGSIGGHALYARYDALGFPLLRATADDGEYVRLGEDAGGATYVLATAWQDNTVRRIDPSTGTAQWSRQADDFTALDSGIATIRNTPATLEVAAVDAGGTQLWQRALTADSSLSFRVATRPAYVGGRVELLANDLAPSDEPCAIYPRFVRLDGIGNPTWFDRPCRTRPESALIWSIDAQSGTGVLVNTLAHLALYSPNGDLRWRKHACEWCSDDSSPSAWAAAVLAYDGGAWALRWDRPSLADPDGRTLIERYDASGEPIFNSESLVNGGSVGNYYDQIAIRPGASDLVMLFAGFHTLYWQRIADDGSGPTVRTTPVSDPFFVIEDARRLPDGSTVVLTKGWGYCNVGCPPFYVTVLRISVDGDLVDRYEFPEIYAPGIPVALDSNGTVAGIVYAADSSLKLRLVDPTGTVNESALSALGSTLWPELLTNSAAGRWWLQAESNSGSGELTQASIDNQGQLLGERHDGSYAWLSRSTPFGVFNIGPQTKDMDYAALLDSTTLAERARFYNGSGLTYGPGLWSFANDGSVYGTITLPLNGHQAIARYSVPGTTPSDVIFRNAFD